MSDASLVSFLQSELLLLSNEIKKKYPEIKEVRVDGGEFVIFKFNFLLQSVENIFQLIRKIKDDPERPNAVEGTNQNNTFGIKFMLFSCLFA